MRLPDYLSLMWEARRALLPEAWRVVLRGIVQSCFMEVIAREEERQLSREVAGQEPSDPIFILGFPRSGTTHLLYLLNEDERLASPTYLQVMHPHSFFFLEGSLLGPQVWLISKLYFAWLRYACPTVLNVWEGRGFDNVPGGANYPHEDGYALLMMKQDDEVLQAFPSLYDKYSKYLTLRGLEPGLVERWKDSWMGFLKKLSLRYPEKTLLLKSPSHTAKVRVILELFPRAKFIHIRRDPYVVYSSFRRYREHAIRGGESYCRPRGGAEVEKFIGYYRAHYTAYLVDRELIPEGNLYEMKHEDLVESPLTELELAYDTLSLDFSECRPSMERYAGVTKDYRQNKYPPLSAAERDAISGALGQFFEAFGYAT